MSADAVVQNTRSSDPTDHPLGGVPRPRSGAEPLASAAGVAEQHPVRRVRRRVLCHLGVHTSVFAWAPGRGVWCNHCHTQVTQG